MWWFALAVLAHETDSGRAPLLAPGDPSPPIEVGTWLRGGPITPGASGKATLVEFTASWCQPCEVFRPELVAIASEHADQLDVVAVHVFEEGLAAVEGYVARHETDGLAPNLAYSPVEAPYAQATWMDAAGRDGIPTIFLVEPNGTIAWIGYPGSGLGSVLPDLLAGTWDSMAERDDYLRAQLREELQEAWVPLLTNSEGKPLKPAMALFTLRSAESEEPQTRYALAEWWFDSLLATDTPQALAYAGELTHHTDEVTGRVLGDIAWQLVGNRRLHGDPAVARILAEAAVQRYDWADPDLLDTLAYVLWVQGDTEGAIEVQERAVAVSTSEPEARWYGKAVARYRRQAAKHHPIVPLPSG